ncbi:helix-hairpin-helix domain-containing protein [Salinactinospora qingdaonensis]|uniref:Pathogenicity locus n=1 Tax=Salinactinospora qingdaonensis TaxID=702744 RepID=A0ABP7GC38_9ACTN
MRGSPASTTAVTRLANVGPALERRLNRIGITRVGHLCACDPVELYERICVDQGRREDLCLLDVLMSAVDQAAGAAACPWWHYTPHRKRVQAQREGGGALPPSS